ncbi:hypothetical protein ABG067_002161 [Albugo candida]
MKCAKKLSSIVFDTANESPVYITRMNTARNVRHRNLALLIVYSSLYTCAIRVPIRIIPHTGVVKPVDHFRAPNSPLGPFSTNFPECLHLDTFWKAQNAKLTVCPYEKAILQVFDKDHRTILHSYTLGIYRGWSIEPLYLRYKSMVFDDGSQCPEHDAEALAMQLELKILLTDKQVPMQLMDFRAIDMCRYRVSLRMATIQEFDAPAGILAPGALYFSNKEETLEKACEGKICEYSVLLERIKDIQDAVEKLKDVVRVEVHQLDSPVAEAASSTLEGIISASSNILIKSIRLFNKLETMSINEATQYQSADSKVNREATIAQDVVSDV